MGQLRELCPKAQTHQITTDHAHSLLFKRKKEKLLTCCRRQFPSPPLCGCSSKVIVDQLSGPVPSFLAGAEIREAEGQVYGRLFNLLPSSPIDVLSSLLNL